MAGITGKLPKLTGASGMCFRRSHFLDGTLNTYFGPGQNPDVVTLPGPPFASEYYPPNDWRPAGGILTPPQVVWLSLAQVQPEVPTFFTVTPKYAILQWTSTGSSGLYPVTWKWTDGFQVVITGVPAIDNAVNNGPPDSWGNRVGIFTGGGPPPPGVLNGTTASIFPQLLINTPVTTPTPNPCAPDYAALFAAFTSAATTINQLRAGKTWVQIYDWTTADPTFQSFQANGFTGDVGPTAMIPFTAPWRTDLLAPTPEELPFFGTDFLHIHTGAWAAGQFPPTLTALEAPRGVFDPSNLAFGEANVKSSYSSFVRFSVQLYSVPPLTLNYAPFVPVPSTSAPSGASPGQTLLPTTLLPPGTSSANFLPFAQFLPLFNSAQMAAQASMVAVTPGWQNNIQVTQQQIATDLADFGYTYSGPESNISDVVALIANHFGFDPDTGKDLPQSG